MKVLLIIVGVTGALLFGLAAKLGPLEAEPLKAIVGWTISIASLVSAVWLAKLKLPAWAAIFGAMAIALNMLAPLQAPTTWLAPLHITCGVLCAACVVRNWE